MSRLRRRWSRALLALAAAAVCPRRTPAPSEEDRVRRSRGAPSRSRPPDEAEARRGAQETSSRPRRRRTSTGAAPMPGEPTRRAAPASAPDQSRDEAILGAGAPSADHPTRPAPEDPLKIGGQFYLRAQTTAQRGADARRLGAVSAPSLLDVYLDARPNDRVRGFVLGRMIFDPTLPPAARGGPDRAPALDTGGGSWAPPTLTSLFAPATAGRTRCWTRCGCASTSPARSSSPPASSTCAGAPARFWNAHRLPARPPAQPAGRVRRPHRHHHAEAARALGGAGLELLRLRPAGGRRRGPPRVGQVGGRGRAPRSCSAPPSWAWAAWSSAAASPAGGRLSTGIWDLDFYGEVALRYGSEIDRVVVDAATSVARRWSHAGCRRRAPATRSTATSGLKPQVVGRRHLPAAVQRQRRVRPWAPSTSTTRSATPRPRLPGPVCPGSPRWSSRRPSSTWAATTGRCSSASLRPTPGTYTTFTLSTLGNLSDRSFITRLDYSLQLLTHLRFEAFVAVHYGTREGEFRFGVTNFQVAGRDYSIPPMILDLGLASAREHPSGREPLRGRLDL